MRWGLIRIIIFASAFLVGLLMFNSGGPSIDVVISAPPVEHQTSEGKCAGSGNLVLTHLQQSGGSFTLD